MRQAEPTDSELFAAYHASPSVALRNQIVERHRGLAVALARRFDRRGVPLEDLVQVAQIALIKAVERFDPGREVKFTTFATQTVFGEIKRHFRDKTWAIRVPRGIKDLHLSLAPALQELQQSLRRSPTVAELAEHLATSEDLVLEAIEAGAAYVQESTDERLAEGEGSDMAFRLAVPDRGTEEADMRLTVQELMARLPERERKIVYLRYYEDMTQSEIGERLGISQVHVSRLLKEALERLGRQG